MLRWVIALIRRRPGRVLGVAAGVAVVVALVSVLGGFVTAARATASARAISTVAVDWQLQLATGTDEAGALRTVRSFPRVASALPVTYGRVSALTATTGQTTQRTGAARVLGLPADYRSVFAGQVRQLTGVADGALVAQQTASNLHVVPGDVVQVSLGGDTRSVRVAGVVELPMADSLFQTVGAPAGSQPSAPPDNVLLLPERGAASLFSQHQDLVTRQLHVRLRHDFAADPAAAYTQVTQASNNLTVRLAGTGVVGDNLAAALDAARSDAAYGDVLFLFLGLPGVVLSGVLTCRVSTAASTSRRREQALLRVRGATRRRLVLLGVAEGIAGGLLGAAGGLLLAVAAELGLGLVPARGLLSAGQVSWALTASVVGVLLAVLAVVLPSLRSASTATVTASRRGGLVDAGPRWQIVAAGGVLVVVGVAACIASTRSGYSVVLAPEGVAALSVDYAAFVGPACLWVGGAALLHQGTLGLLGRPLFAQLAARPAAPSIRLVLAALLVRRRCRLAAAAVLTAVAFAFAFSTATFDATYQRQSEVDARLTNGSDVRVEVHGGASSATLAAIRHAEGVRSAEPVQHRFAYVGSDLQDLYGVRPGTIASATSLQNAYFVGGSAARVLQRLQAEPDGILVSAETVSDYGLRLGDRITLRVPSPRGGAPIAARFRYVGQVLEFPTAPRDSFLVANTSYLAQLTGAAPNTILIRSTAPAATAAALQHTLGTSAAVTSIEAVRSTIGSSLTAVDLSGLTRVELAFAVLLAAASAGLLLLLDVQERRRSFAVMTVLGASARRVRQLVTIEAFLTTVLGLVSGTALGGAIAGVLVAVLSGVFDPPPEAPLVPYGYLAAVVGAAVVSVVLAVLVAFRSTDRPAVEVLRGQ